MKLALLLSLLASCSVSNSTNEISMEEINLVSGQVWKYNTRKGEETSRVTILKIEETNDLQEIIHIAISDVKIQHSKKKDVYSTEIGHLPFSKESLKSSLTTLESTREKLPDYMEGYNQWKDAYDKGEAGIFTTSIKEAVDFIEQSMNN